MPCVHACACVHVRAWIHIYTLMPSISNFEQGEKLPRTLEHDGVGANPNAVCITNFICM